MGGSSHGKGAKRPGPYAGGKGWPDQGSGWSAQHAAWDDRRQGWPGADMRGAQYAQWQPQYTQWQPRQGQGPPQPRQEKGSWPARTGDGGNRKGAWSGLQELASTTRLALEAARDLRSTMTVLSGGADSQADTEPQGWLSAAKGWLLGSPRAEAQQPVAAGRAAAKTETPGTEELLARLLGAPSSDKQTQEQNELEELKRELQAQKKLLGALVDKTTEEDPRRVTLPVSRTSGPSGSGGGGNPMLEELTKAVREQLEARKANAAGAQPEQPTEAAKAADVAKQEFDIDGSVTAAAHRAFWNWLDDTPRAPWEGPAPYAEWLDKMSYKCKKQELTGWVEERGLSKDGQTSRKELLDALARGFRS